MQVVLVELPIATDEGQFIASYSSNGLAALSFPGPRKSSSSKTAPSPEMLRWHRVTTVAVQKILDGKNPNALPPFDLSVGTEFQQAVWLAMLKIDCGQTRSYGELATAIGKPKAVRAVGQACGANPIPVIIPCHRVLAANQKIGGFSSGLDWKRKLLAREGAVWW